MEDEKKQLKKASKFDTSKLKPETMSKTGKEPNMKIERDIASLIDRITSYNSKISESLKNSKNGMELKDFVCENKPDIALNENEKNSSLDDENVEKVSF